MLSRLMVCALLAYACAGSTPVDAPAAKPWHMLLTESDIFGVYIGHHLAMDSSMALVDTIAAPDSLIVLRYVTLHEGRVDIVRLDLASEYPEAVFNQMEGHLNGLYGTSSPTQGYATWSAGDHDNRLIEISLTDRAYLYGQKGLVRIEWKAHEDRRYWD